LQPLETSGEINEDFGDMILVLGGGLKRGNEIGFSTEERLNLAVELYKQKARMIVISDGSLYKRSPAINKFDNYLLTRGIKREHIKYEGKSQTTYDNILYAKSMLEKGKFKQIIICTSPYHQKRSAMIISYLKIKNFKIAKMRESEIFLPGTIKQRLRNMRLVFREYFAILKFKLFKR
jgi:uncharacterized SAM-binding protein YcdF (DUF218 family)